MSEKGKSRIFSLCKHYSPMELCSGEARMFRARSRLGMVWRSTRREGDLHQSQLSSLSSPPITAHLKKARSHRLLAAPPPPPEMAVSDTVWNSVRPL